MKKLFILASIALFFAACNTPKEETVLTQQEATIQTIMQRKSVRTFAPGAVSDSTIQMLLKAAMAAPTGMNVQPWSFIVLNDTASYDTIFRDNFNLHIYKQSAFVVVFCADTTVTRAPKDNPDAPAITTPNAIWRDDMGACTENFLLAVEACGLGAVWTACYPFPDRMNPIRECLNIPDDVVPYSVVPVGIPGGDDMPKDKWKPERIHYNQW